MTPEQQTAADHLSRLPGIRMPAAVARALSAEFSPGWEIGVERTVNALLEEGTEGIRSLVGVICHRIRWHLLVARPDDPVAEERRRVARVMAVRCHGCGEFHDGPRCPVVPVSPDRIAKLRARFGIPE